MFKIQKCSIVALLVGSVVSGTVLADDANSTKEKNDFNDKASYAVGVLIGSNLKQIVDSQKEFISYDNKRVLVGVEDALNGKVDLTKNQDLKATLEAIQDKLQKVQEEKMAKIAEQAKVDGDKYVAEFAKQPGVKMTKSGLLYKIITMGSGKPIKATDTVTVNYTGKLPNGDVFDSSNGKPVSFKLNQVIPGWIEGLQLVKKGGKIELVLSPKLAYGDHGAGVIPPNATLHFDVEVVDVKSE